MTSSELEKWDEMTSGWRNARNWHWRYKGLIRCNYLGNFGKISMMNGEWEYLWRANSDHSILCESNNQIVSKHPCKDYSGQIVCQRLLLLDRFECACWSHVCLRTLSATIGDKCRSSDVWKHASWNRSMNSARLKLSVKTVCAVNELLLRKRHITKRGDKQDTASNIIEI